MSYFKGPFSITGQARYTSSGDKQNPKVAPGEPGFDPSLTRTVTDNTVPSHTTVNPSASYDLDVGRLEGLQLFGTVNHVFDEDPPYAAGSTGGTNPLFFAALGRTYRLGVRMEF